MEQFLGLGMRLSTSLAISTSMYAVG